MFAYGGAGGESVEMYGSGRWLTSFFTGRRGFGFRMVSSLSLFYQERGVELWKNRSNGFTGA